MFRTFEAVLQPTHSQSAALDRLLDSQRELYNAALEERIGVWRWQRRAVSRVDQFRSLTGWSHPTLDFGVCPARGTLTRLDRAFAAFYRRYRKGEKAGFPRFKGANRWHSVEYPAPFGWRLKPSRCGGAGRLSLMGVGSIRFRGSRRGLLGTPRTLVVRREGARWRVTVVCSDVSATLLEPTERSVGIDVGVREIVATSGGECYANPRHLRESLDRLASAQRVVAGRRRGSNRRRKASQRVGTIQRRVARQRRDLAHRISRQLVNQYDLIVYEDLDIDNMVRRPRPRPNEEGGFDPNGAAAKGGLNREILAAGWGQLLRFIVYKAEEAGRETIAVNARYTSQTCHRCGHVAANNRHGSEFRCKRCQFADHADVNAARNILRAGLAHRSAREADDQVASGRASSSGEP